MDNTSILGIDPSTTVVGWCAWRSDGGPTTSGQINLKKKGRDAWSRLEILAERVDDLVSGYLKCGLETVIACEETMGSHGNLDTDRKLGASMGIVLAVAVRYGCPFVRVHPRKVKATGFCKDDWVTMASAAVFVGKDKVGEDEADAIGVTQAARIILRERELCQERR